MSSIAHAKSRQVLLRRLCWVALLGSLILIVPIQRGLDRARGPYGKVAEVIYLSSGRSLRPFCLGHEGLVADIYWTRVVQYFGRRHLEQTGQYDLLGKMLRITTELDPQLIIAYRFGSLFLAEKPPSGAGRPEEALDLLRRGIAENPEYWRLWQDLGFIYYWDLKDYRHAARVFQAGSERPGALLWMKAMAASVAAKGNDLRTSLGLWSEIYRNGETESMRMSAREHLAALQAEQELAQLNALLAQYKEREGRPARSFQELVLSRWLSRIPRDPSGVSYLIGLEGQAILSPQSKVDMRLLQ